MHPRLNVSQITTLINLRTREAREALEVIALDPATPPYALGALARKRGTPPSVHTTLKARAADPTTPTRVLAEIGPHFPAEAAANPATPPQVLTQIVDGGVRSIAAKEAALVALARTDTPAATLAACARPCIGGERYTLIAAANPSTPPEALGEVPPGP